MAYLQGLVERGAEEVADAPTVCGELDVPHLLPVHVDVLVVPQIREAELIRPKNNGSGEKNATSNIGHEVMTGWASS